MRAKGYPIIHTREGHKPDLSRPAGQQALALAADRRRHRRSGTVRPHPGARRAGLGDHPRAAAGAGRGDHRQAGQGHLPRHRFRPGAADQAHPQHRLHRRHHRRLRAHHDARRQRPRLRVPAAGGLLRGDQGREPSRRDRHDQDAGRRVRRGGDVRRHSSRRCHERRTPIAAEALPCARPRSTRSA